MRLPFLRRDYAIEALERTDSAAIALIHREDFVRPWTDGEFDSLLSQDAVFGFAAREVGNPKAPMAGFVLARSAAGEGEVLTVAVARAHRRMGLGRQLMDAVLRTLRANRAEALFLEVEENNLAAVTLYRRLGFIEVGRRPDYYQTIGAGRANALVMRRDLR